VPAAHDEYGARGGPYDAIGDAAHQQPSHAGTPVGAHDHEIDAVLPRGSDDRCCSWSVSKQRGDADDFSLRRSGKPLQALSGGIPG